MKFRYPLGWMISTAILLTLSAYPSCARQIKIATYNVENLFDAYDDPYANDTNKYRDGALLVKPVEELESAAKVITKVNADVLALQEVENRGILDAFNRKYLSSLGYKYSELIEGNDPRGIDVAILSRFPIGKVTSHRHLRLDDGTGKERLFSRDLLGAVITIPYCSSSLTIFTTHLKSQSGGKEADLQRYAEARKVRQILDWELRSNPRSLFALMGDFNDASDMPTIRILSGRGATFVRPLPCKAPDGSTWTEDSRREDEYPPIRFDYIFVSPALNPRVIKCGIYRPAKSTLDYLTLRQASDHCPVWAIIDIK